MQNITTGAHQPPKTGKTERRHGLLIISLILLIVLLIGVSIYFIIRASNPAPKPEWWVGDFCLRFLNWNVIS